MNKELLLKVLGGSIVSSSLVSSGAAGYHLISKEKINKIEIKKINDRGPIIKFTKSKGNWTYKREFGDSKLTLVCTSKGIIKGEGECNRYIKTKKENQTIFVFDGRVTHATLETFSWPEYKFTFKDEVEDNKRVYHGKCNDKVDIEDPENLCSTTNLPEGWTKEKVKEENGG